MTNERSTMNNERLAADYTSVSSSRIVKFRKRLNISAPLRRIETQGAECGAGAAPRRQGAGSASVSAVIGSASAAPPMGSSSTTSTSSTDIYETDISETDISETDISETALVNSLTASAAMGSC